MSRLSSFLVNTMCKLQAIGSRAGRLSSVFEGDGKYSTTSCSNPYWPLLVVLLLSVSLSPAQTLGQAPPPPESPSPPQSLDFARDIQPILTEKCLKCHAGDEPAGELKLGDHGSLLGKGASGKAAVVAGKTSESELWKRIASDDDEVHMPPMEEAQLKPEELGRLQQWIDDGAPWSLHWAFRPLLRPQPPRVSAASVEVHAASTHAVETERLNLQSWTDNPIDRFVLAKLIEHKVTPAPRSDRTTLIKRLYYDLVGLPPSIAAVDAFICDDRPDAYDRLVTELLDSPHFGERWGRHWLDIAHYADSDGFEKDKARADAYLYRDWVIQSLNRDQPFDQFSIEQLAGDLLPQSTSQQRIATAFLRQTLTNEEGGVDQEEYRIAACFDRAETVGTAWLGLTVGCCRCHTHKYDPLPHTDYYKLLAFFNNADESLSKLVISAENQNELERAVAPLESELEERYRSLAPDALRWATEQRELVLARKAGDKDVAAIDDKDIASALEMYPEKRVAATKQKLFDFFVDKIVKDERVQQLRDEIASLRKTHKAKLTDVRTIASPRLPRTTYVFHRGDFLSPGDPVTAGTPAVLTPFTARDREPDRLDLARWLVSRKNDLTPRVAVNQVWQHLFGKGLVRTPGDFGARGEPPTHPELLDWLAVQFRDDLAWSRKGLIRLIVTSATYQQASNRRSEIDELDPDNRLLARQNRFRVESEIVRDLNLAAAGLLSDKVGGPSVFPPMPDELAKLSYANSFTWKESTGADRYRRGMYTFFKRTIPHPNLVSFDAPDANVACVQRDVSNTPLQSLTLLNNAVHHEAAQGFAARVLADPSKDVDTTRNQGSQESKDKDANEDLQRLRTAWRVCVVREPTASELDELAKLLTKSRGYYLEHEEDAARLASAHSPASVAKSEFAAWVATLRVVLNLDEFLTRE